MTQRFLPFGLREPVREPSPSSIARAERRARAHEGGALIGRRSSRRILAALSHRYAAPAIVGIALLLVSPYLGAGALSDDNFHTVALRGQPDIAGAARAPWDLFTFASAETNRALIEEGAFPWWTDPDLRIAFYRPISSLMIWLDHALWPEQPVLMHLHSMVWFGLLLGAVAFVYRELSLSKRHAALALLLYAIDDARSVPVAWLAQRNALIALFPAFLALVAHHRWRASGSRRAGLLAPLALLVGLHGGESALAVCGYLFAYAVVFERGPWRSRLRTLLPYAGVVVAWAAVYELLGRGALHSGVYIDPVHDPLEFSRQLLVRLPILLLSQFGLPFADLWEGYPLVSVWLQPLALAFAVFVLGGLYLLLRPLLRAQPLLRFWLIGTLLATIPACGVHPEDRMLTATSLGGASLLAALLLALLEKTYPNPGWAGLISGRALLLVHVVLAPLLLPLRAFDLCMVDRLIVGSITSFPSGPEIASETVVLLNPPIDIFAVYLPLFRSARHIPRPRQFRWLATGESDLYVERVDARTLKLRPAQGFLSTTSQVMFRRADRPMPAGRAVSVGDVEFSVTDVTSDGRPAEVQVRFDRELESKSLRWLQWGTYAYVPFTPPAIGQSTVVPKVDLATLLQSGGEDHG